jgi:ribosome-associated toxin RatA of RatAB toxin-antitoxin module
MEKIIFTSSEIDLPCSMQEALNFFKNLEQYPSLVAYSKSLNIIKKTAKGYLKEMNVTLSTGENYYSKSVANFFEDGFRIRQVEGKIKDLSWRLKISPSTDQSCHVVSTHRFGIANLKVWPKLPEMIKDIEQKLLYRVLEKMTESQDNIVITGLGIVSNQGSGKELLLAGVKNRLLEQSKTFTAYVPHFDPSKSMPLKYVGRTDRSNQLALAAVQEALQQSGLKNYLPEEVGIVVCNFLCGINYVEKQSRILREEGPQNISKYLSLAFFPCGTAGMISLIHQIKGYSNTLGGIESSGEQAIQLAEEALKNGKAKFMLVGATEAPLIDLFRQGYAQKYGDQAANHLSEASCFLVLEKKRTALERNVPVLASLNDLKQMMGAPLFSALRYSLCGDALSANHFIEFAFKILKADEFLNKRELLKDFSKELNRQSISKTKEVEQNAIF